ncbi:hypothetical protein AJ79_00874 [Helicocarpus griseus UAMH5409]|uniref:Uncharacterized protein n=1 Tax=Helicocarpus griseus UAMH5409 TaxID=1447875 RepID=A0A2B7Y9L9_9EURO|nr:hypothetical protein AJ79_00874 [Helicocarpus griseus UAMH5409]
MSSLLDQELLYTYNLGNQGQNPRNELRNRRRHTDMAEIPRIECCSWDEPQHQSYVPASKYQYPPRPPLDTPVSIFTEFEDDPDEERTIKKSKSDTGMRRGFWSKLVKPRNENHRHSADMLTTYARPDHPQQAAMASVKLVWSHEHQIWMFPNSRSEEEHGHHHHNHHQQHQKHWWPALDILRPRSTPLAPRTSSDEYLFAQLPGHYPLSNYGPVNNEEYLPAYTPGRNLGDVATRTGTESQWTLVASRVNGAASVH